MTHRTHNHSARPVYHDFLRSAQARLPGCIREASATRLIKGLKNVLELTGEVTGDTTHKGDIIVRNGAKVIGNITSLSGTIVVLASTIFGSLNAGKDVTVMNSAIDGDITAGRNVKLGHSTLNGNITAERSVKLYHTTVTGFVSAVRSIFAKNCSGGQYKAGKSLVLQSCMNVASAVVEKGRITLIDTTVAGLILARKVLLKGTSVISGSEQNPSTSSTASFSNPQVSQQEVIAEEFVVQDEVVVEELTNAEVTTPETIEAYDTAIAAALSPETPADDADAKPDDEIVSTSPAVAA